MFATASGSNTACCQNCDTTTTPLWRKAEDGTNLCNACGLFLKLHGRSRPIALKSNIIRSRNRARTTHAGVKSRTPYDAPTTPGEIARKQKRQLESHELQTLAASPTPYEPHPRALVPTCQQDDTHAQFTENVFDSHFSHPVNQVAVHHSSEENPCLEQDSETRQNDEVLSGLESLNAALRARVNELEIINDLFRSRVTELEARQQHEENASSKAVGSLTVESDLRLQIEELEAKLQECKCLESRQADVEALPLALREEVLSNDLGTDPPE